MTQVIAVCDGCGEYIYEDFEYECKCNEEQ